MQALNVVGFWVLETCPPHPPGTQLGSQDLGGPGIHTVRLFHPGILPARLFERQPCDSEAADKLAFPSS